MLAGLQQTLRLGSFRRLRRDEEGATAIEFAIVVTPFLMFVFALIGTAFYFFIISSIEKGMDQASRLVRTGQAVAAKTTVDQFKQQICAGAGDWIDCSKLQIFAENWDDWASNPPIQPHECTDNGAPAQNEAQGSEPIALYTGDASKVVIVTACYKWDLTTKIPFIKLGNYPDGSMMMQTATAFRSEPYPEN
jgi:Flp pilus assembly protein TadG